MVLLIISAAIYAVILSLYLQRRKRIKSLNSEYFPDVPKDIFNKWQNFLVRGGDICFGMGMLIFPAWLFFLLGLSDIAVFIIVCSALSGIILLTFAVGFLIDANRLRKNHKINYKDFPGEETVMKKLNITSLIALVFTVVVVIFLISLTRIKPYLYDKMTLYKNVYPIRSNLFSGETEIFFPETGWKNPNESSIYFLPSEQLEKITGTASINGDELEMDIYNGTDWEIYEIFVEVTLREKIPTSNPVNAGEYLKAATQAPIKYQRVYRFSGEEIPPYSCTNVNDGWKAKLGFTRKSGQFWSWTITKAKGIEN